MASLLLPTINGKLVPEAAKRRATLRGLVALGLPLSQARFVPTWRERIWFAVKSIAFRLNGGWV